MDEVYYRCWESNPNITEWMRVNNYNSTRYVEQYYMGRVLQNTKNIGYKSIVWEDVLNNGVEVDLFERTFLVFRNKKIPLNKRYLKTRSSSCGKPKTLQPQMKNYGPSI